MKKRSISIKLIWMGAYLAVVLLMCLVFFVGTIMVTGTVKDSARQTNEELAMFMQKTLDENWQTVFENSMQLVNSSRAEALNKSRAEQDFTDLSTYHFVSDFRQFVQSNRMVEAVHMYFPGQDWIVGSKGTYASHTYWTAMYGLDHNPEYTYDTWMTDLFGSRSIGYFIIQNGNHMDLYYRLSVFAADGRILVVKINTEKLEDTLHWICEDTENSFLGMVDTVGNVYAYSGNYEKFINTQSNQLLPVDEDTYLYTEIVSDITSLRYVAVKEQSNAYRQSNTVTNLALIFLLFAFLSGVGVAVFAALRTTRPVRQLAEKLGGDDPIAGNELQYIGKQIDDLLQENRNALDALTKEQNRMIGRTFLNECLKFTQKEHIEVEAIAAICGITFENGLYLVILRERGASDYASDIAAAIDETEDDENVILWTQKQDLDVLLLNYDEQTVVERVMHALQNHSGEHTRIVCGEPTKNPEQIRTMYLDCLRQLQRREVVLLPNTAEPKKEFDALKGKTILGSFQKYLADEDFRNAMLLVPELCSKYLNADRELERNCYRYAVIQQLLNTKSAPDMRQGLVKLSKEEDIAKFEVQLCELLEQCARWRRIHRDNDNDIASSARCIIDEMYADPLLSLHMISEEIGISQSYVSRMFKKKYGIGIAQYINQVRIFNAKKLIQEGSLNIKTISIQVGFSSDVQFIRVFKKMEGITPGAYRTDGDNE